MFSPISLLAGQLGDGDHPPAAAAAVLDSSASSVLSPSSAAAAASSSRERWPISPQMEVMSTFEHIFANTSYHVNTSGTYQVHIGSEVYEQLLAEFRRDLFRLRAGEPLTIALVALYVPTFVAAFLGNLLVLLVVLPNRHMRSVTNCFIVNMAVSDLLVTLVCVPMAIGQSVYKIWVYGEFMCKITNYMQGVAVASSVFTIMALSVDRYLAIKHPMTFRALCAGTHAAKVVAAIWVTAAAIMVPLIMVRRLDVVDVIPREPLHFCNEVWAAAASRQAYDCVLLVFMFVMPGCFVTASYTRIGCKLWRENHTLYRQDSQASREQAEKVMVGRRRVARMLVIIAALFAACWMPYHLLALYLDFAAAGPGEPPGSGGAGGAAAGPALAALPFTILLGHANSALNPVLYCFLNKSFRKCTLKLMRCGGDRAKKKRKQETPVNLVVCYSKMNGGGGGGSGSVMRTSLQLSRRPLMRMFQRQPQPGGGSGTSYGSRSSGSLRFSRSSGSLRGGAGAGSKSTNTSSFRTQQSHVPHGAVRAIELKIPTIITTQDMADEAAAPGSDHHHHHYQYHQYHHHQGKSSPAAGSGAGGGGSGGSGGSGGGGGGEKPRREMFDCTLSIPTTINEESRSCSSRTPSVDRGQPGAAGLGTLAEERSSARADDYDNDDDDDDHRRGQSLSDTEDSGKGSFGEEHAAAVPLLHRHHQQHQQAPPGESRDQPQQQGLVPTVLIAADGETIQYSSSSSSAVYEEAVRYLFGTADSAPGSGASGGGGGRKEHDVVAMAAGDVRRSRETLVPIVVVVTGASTAATAARLS